MTTPTPTPPPTVRLYGFLPITRPRYVFQLILTFALAAAVLALWWTRWPGMREGIGTTPGLERYVQIGDLMPWVVIGVAALQVVEAWFVLRAFSALEASAKQDAKA